MFFHGAFDDRQLSLMRRVLDAVCAELKIANNDCDARKSLSKKIILAVSNEPGIDEEVLTIRLLVWAAAIPPDRVDETAMPRCPLAMPVIDGKDGRGDAKH